MNSYLQPIAEELYSIANADKAVAMKAYMKNQFEFLGIQTPERREICKAYIKQYPVKSLLELDAIVRELWLLPQREFQYFGIELIKASFKIWDSSIIVLIEDCITSKSWWDTVDPLASDCCGRYFTIYYERKSEVTSAWNISDNMWLQRSSLLFQKNYKKDTDSRLLANYIINLAQSKEFFIQKAIGWILREYAKTKADWVIEFVQQNALAPLSKREALKHL